MDDENPIALGSNRTPFEDNDIGQEICILCQETTDIRADGQALVLAAFVQRYGLNLYTIATVSKFY